MTTTAQPPTIEQYKALPAHPKRLCGGRRLHNERPPQKGQPLVTIITAVRNGEKTLRRTIESVLSQSYPAIEYIIIDGASTDGTLGIIRSFDERLDYWISEPDSGISDAFNKGIATASGEIIGILNADDWYEPQAVSVAVPLMKESNAEAVCGALQYWQGRRREYIFYSRLEALKKEMTVNHPATFIKTAAYATHGLFETRYKLAMDYEMILRLQLRGVRFRATEQVWANMSLKGASDRNWRESQREVYQIKSALMNHRFSNALYYCGSLCRGMTARGLESIGLSGAVAFYRRHFSVMKKTRPSA